MNSTTMKQFRLITLRNDFSQSIKIKQALSVNVFSIIEIIEDITFMSPTKYKTTVLHSHPSHARIWQFLGKGSTPSFLSYFN